MKLWGGRFEKSTDGMVDDFHSSITFDQRLYRQDITGSIAHAASDVENPIRQGYFGIFEVFTDTILIWSMTAFVILISGENITYGAAAGTELTIGGFT